MSEEEIEQQLKKSRRQTKDERYEYINSHFYQTNYAMKLEKYALKLHKENKKIKELFCKIYDYLEDNYGYSIAKGTINNTDVDKLYEILNDNLYLLKGDKE